MATSEMVALDRGRDDSLFVPPRQIDPDGRAIDKNAFLDQVDRLLRSDELHGSEGLRRLLKFLAEKSASGEADELKEYTIAVEALGKPTSYDPRHNSAVRILVSKLRQRLASYYQKEGQDDQVLIDLPRGRFKLTCEFRASLIDASLHSSPAPAAHSSSEDKSSVQEFKRFAVTLRTPAWVAVGVAFGILVALAGETIVHRTQSVKAKGSSISSLAGWDASLEELWKPFVAPNRPMVVAIEDPLFVKLQGKDSIYYQEKDLDSWSKAESSPKVKAIRDLGKDNGFLPSHFYTPFQEANVAFSFAKLLGQRVQSLSLVRATDLSMQELADTNLVFIGLDNEFFNQQVQATHFEPSLETVPGGIRNLHPATNEPDLFLNRYSSAPSEDGVVYALVTHIPGPTGGNDIESFTSRRVAGYMAAVAAFTDPGFAQPLVAKLKQAGNGQMPRYYQILLKVEFKGLVPTQTAVVLCRELQYTNQK